MLKVKLAKPEIYDEQQVLHRLRAWHSMIQGIGYLFGENGTEVKVNYSTPTLTQVIIEGTYFCDVVEDGDGWFNYGSRHFKNLPGAVNAAVTSWESKQA